MTNILENLNGVAAIGVGIGLMTVVGQCLGAGRKDEVIYYIKKLSWLAEAAIVISCLTVLALTKPITLLGGMEAESADLCFKMVIFITITKPISWVLSFIPAYGMRAAGDVKFSMITSCCTMWLCRVSLCVYLCRVWGFGPIAVWIGMFADWTLRSHRIFDTLPRKEMVKPPHYRLNKRLSDAVIMKEFSFLPKFFVSSAGSKQISICFFLLELDI